MYSTWGTWPKVYLFSKYKADKLRWPKKVIMNFNNIKTEYLNNLFVFNKNCNISNITLKTHRLMGCTFGKIGLCN